MDNFYLVSTELREPYEPLRCHLVRRLRSELRDDLALVTIEPVLAREVYSTVNDLNSLILASRHEGTSVFASLRSTLAVYICVTDQPIDDNGFIDANSIRILDWGEIGPLAP
jgi:hypothetical protein